MARVRLSPLFSSISGKVGSSIFQATSKGQVLKQRQSYAKNPTQLQVYSLIRTAQVVNAWKNMSSANRALWREYVSIKDTTAKSGDKRILSDYQLFLKYNLIRLAAGLSILESITLSRVVTPLTEILLEIIDGSVEIFVDPDLNLSNMYFLLKMSEPLKDPNTLHSRSLKVIDWSVVSAGNYKVNAGYESKYYTLPVQDDRVIISMLVFNIKAPAFALPFIQNTLVE